MTLTLFDCKPMNAKISKAQCNKNRTMQDNHAIGIMKDQRCKGCPGLGEPTEINVEEIIDMAINKNKPCVKVNEGCKALVWKQGYCWKHHPDHVANKKAACAEKQAIRDIHKLASGPNVQRMPLSAVTETVPALVETTGKGLKHDQGKAQWYAMPLEIAELLADIFSAGEQKYSIFNCLQPFEDGDRRFYDATMRDLKECQRNPLARDEETGCYHGSQAAWNMLLRTYHAEKAARNAD